MNLQGGSSGENATEDLARSFVIFVFASLGTEMVKLFRDECPDYNPKYVQVG